MFAAENMIRHVAKELGMPETQLMEINLFQESHLTHYNQSLDNCNVRRYIR